MELPGSADSIWCRWHRYMAWGRKCSLSLVISMFCCHPKFKQVVGLPQRIQEAVGGHGLDAADSFTFAARRAIC